MEGPIIILSVLGALLIAALSPGPSFVFVARTSIAVSRSAGFAAALGMGVGGVIFGGLALLGLHAALTQVTWLYAAVKLLGAGYLVYLGYRLWRGAARPMVVPEMAGRQVTELAGSLVKTFSLALATQLSNPKAALVYGGIFAALVPPGAPMWLWLALLPLVLLVESGWYVMVAAVLSTDRPRALYLAAKAWVDRLAGSIMGLLGLRLALDVAR